MADGIVHHHPCRQAFEAEGVHPAAHFIGPDIAHKYHVVVIDDAIAVQVFPDSVAAYFFAALGFNIVGSIGGIGVGGIHPDQVVSPAFAISFAFGHPAHFFIGLRFGVIHIISSCAVFVFAIIG